jgi:hypothetical protein
MRVIRIGTRAASEEEKKGREKVYSSDIFRLVFNGRAYWGGKRMGDAFVVLSLVLHHMLIWEGEERKHCCASGKWKLAGGISLSSIIDGLVLVQVRGV